MAYRASVAGGMGVCHCSPVRWLFWGAGQWRQVTLTVREAYSEGQGGRGVRCHCSHNGLSPDTQVQGILGYVVGPVTLLCPIQLMVTFVLVMWLDFLSLLDQEWARHFGQSIAVYRYKVRVQCESISLLGEHSLVMCYCPSPKPVLLWFQPPHPFI